MNETDAVKTAANELDTARGENAPRPRGGARKGAGRKPSKGKTARPIEPASEAEVQAHTFLAGTVWKISARLFKMEDLLEDERQQLGEAIAPVVAKYMPQFEQYAPEANLIIMVGGLIIAKQKKAAPKPDDSGNGSEEPDTDHGLLRITP